MHYINEKMEIMEIMEINEIMENKQENLKRILDYPKGKEL